MSSSSSSDDEFLTSPDIVGGAINGEDGREALVRKKLLESFYGDASPTISIGDDCVVNDSVVVDSVKMEANQFDNYDKVLSLSATTKQASFTITTTTQITLPFNATKSDLDSPIFTPKTYTLSHIVHSPLETLLITNEYLALDIRTLDSTMQTLVYENYSKFINATDAIKCIGVNVSSISGGEQMMTTTSNEQEPNIKGEGNTAHENHGLQRLLKGINNIQLTSTKSERLLHESREAVAEKLRIQRLLVRLDALLSLPTTLRTYISQGKYRLAVQSHGSATEILGRHSDKGFESLKSIEVECGVILNELVIGLKSKLIYWSGGSSSSYDNNNLLKGLSGDNRTAGSSTYSTSMSRPPPPKSIAEIFECAGTILMLYSSFTPGFDKYQCQTLALAACGQYLRELLTGDTSLTSSGSPRGRKKRGAALTCTDTESKGAVLELPMSFLDGILEATTLYGVSFPSSTPTDKTDTGQDSLQKFVTSNFDKFISHVHMLLIQQSDDDGSSNTKLQGTSSGDDDDGEESNDNINFHQVSIALGHLIRSIRELASGLALPEVGLDVLLASTLVDQTMELAEMLVRRLVSRKFHQLRSVVVTECLAPLVMEVSKAGDVFVKQDGITSSTLGGMVQLANVALSDGLQMADDLIRDTLQYSQANLITTPVNTEVMKLAVQREAKLFGFWLASTLEQLVGYRNDGSLLEVHDHREEGENDWQQQTKKNKIIPQLKIEEVGDCQHWTTAPFYYTHSSADSFKEGDTSNLVMNLLVQLDDGLSDRAYTNFLLAICEMCRLAERSIANTLNQSIQSAMEEDSRVADSANTLFGNSVNPNRKGKEGLDSEQILSKRFQLAASRALAMYTMNRGAHAASEIFTDMYCLSDARDPYAIPHKPRRGCLKVFDIVKASCEDCITIVGGDLFVLPLPPFPDEIEYTNVFGDRLTESRGNGGGGGTSTGLQLDVERMFIEKSQVYPHSLDRIEFTRNSVTSGILRVALAAFMECVRSSVVSSLGYRQLKVDAIFLRYIIPHYVNDEFGTDDANACSSLLNIIDDVMLKAEQRCLDHEVTSDDDYYDVKKDEIYTPFQIVQRYCNADKVVKKVSF